MSQARFARLAGVERSTVLRAAKDGALAAARLEDGRLDARHPDAMAWLSERGHDPELLFSAPPAPNKSVPDELTTVAALEQLTLRQLTDRFGTDERFHAWSRARKELAMARRAEEQVDRLKRRVIPRTVVQTLFDSIDTAQRAMLGEAASTLAGRLPSSPTREARTTLAQEILSQYFRAARDRMTQALRADDPQAPLHDAGPADRGGGPEPLAVAAARQLRTRLTAIAAPQIGEFLSRSHSPRAAPDIERYVTNVIAAHADNIIRELGLGQLEEHPS